MQRLLVVKSSILGEKGHSSALADYFLNQWKKLNPDGDVVTRDLAVDPIPHLTLQRFSAMATPADALDPEQRVVAEESNALINELKSATTVLLAVPMYNLGIPSSLKAYLDHVTRSGVTFQYSAQGVKGLLGGREVVVLSTRGGRYAGTNGDVQMPYLRSILNFLGMTDIRCVYAEGLALGEESCQASLQQARAEISGMLRDTEVAAA